MKNTFFEYNMHRLGHIETIKKDSIIVLDANALLNLYRYNKENRVKFFEILKKVENRLFLTNQSVEEFYRNRLSILKDKSNFNDSLKFAITKELKSLNNTIENTDFKGDKSSSCQLLKYELDLKNNLTTIIKKTINEINESIDKHKNGIDKNYLKEDPLLDEIEELFEKKINIKLDKSRLGQIYKEGKERYKNNIPPGYEDLRKNKKPEPECYGDLVIWNEMIEISKSKSKHILFVSDDTKEDWCEKVSGQNLGPRKELIREFYEETNNFFYSFTTSEFIKHISELYKITNTEGLEKESDIIRESLESISKNNSEVALKASELASVADQYREALKASELASVADQYREALKVSGLASVANQYREALKVSGLASVADQYREALKVSGLASVADQYREALKVSGLASVANQYREALKAMEVCGTVDPCRGELELTETSSIYELDNK